MKRKIYALDLGNKVLKIGVGDEDESGKINLLTKLSKNIESFSDGEIIDPYSFETEIIETLKEIAYQIGEEPKEIILSLSATSFNFQRTKGKISVSEKYVTDEDIKRCLSVAKVSLNSGSYEIVFEEPIRFFLDGSQIKVRDPLGMEAHTLEVDFFVIQGLRSSLGKLRDFFKRNGIKINFVLPNPLPASYIVLSKKEKELGVILIDFGYRLFNVSIFQEGKMIDYRVFRFGLGDILEDLALDLGVDVNYVQSFLEEILKEEVKKKAKIKIGKKNYSWHNFLKLLEKKLAFYLKKNNLTDFFKKTKETIRIPSGIYIIGGGSFLPEIENLIKKYSSYPAKVGIDLMQTLNKEERIFFNVLGSLYYSQRVSSPKSLLETIKDIFKSLRGL